MIFNDSAVKVLKCIRLHVIEMCVAGSATCAEHMSERSLQPFFPNDIDIFVPCYELMHNDITDFAATTINPLENEFIARLVETLRRANVAIEHVRPRQCCNQSTPTCSPDLEIPHVIDIKIEGIQQCYLTIESTTNSCNASAISREDA